mgnify:CR=1 FL=1
MLRVFDISNSITTDMSKEDEEKIYNLQHQTNELFKSSNNNILYFEEKKYEIEEYLGIKIYHDKSIIDYIKYFDCGEFLDVSHYGCWQIEISECIEEFIENIDEYEKRLFNSKDFDKEIQIIIKEQMIKVFGNHINEAIKIINNGNFEWD